MRAVDVNMNASVVVQTSSRPPKDLNLKDVLATRSNLDVVQMELRFLKGHTTTAAIAHKPNSNAVLMELPRPKDRTLRDAIAQLANMDVVRMALQMHRVHNLKVARTFQLWLRRLVVLARMAVLAATTQLNTSSIANMAVAQDSGTADAVVTTIDSNHLKIVNKYAKNHKIKRPVCCQKYTAHVSLTHQCSTTIQIETPALNLFMVAVLETIIVSKLLKLVKNYASLMNHYVSSRNAPAYTVSMLNNSFVIAAPCDQPLEEGPCNGNYERWYFDKDQDVCRPFRYGGCKGNKNNYPTEQACSYQCKTPGVRKGILTDKFFFCIN